MGIRDRRLLERRASRQPANIELGERVTDEAVPLAAVADSTAKLAPIFYKDSVQQEESQRYRVGEVKGTSQANSLF